MNSTSLRLRLLALAIGSIVATLAVAGVSLGLLFEQQLLRRVDRELDQKWTELAASFRVENGKAVLHQPLTDPRYDQPYSGAYWQITGHDTVLRSRSLWDEVLETTHVPAADKERSFEVAGPQNSELYVTERDVRLDNGGTFRLAVALDHAEVHDLRAAFEWDMAKVLAAIAVVLSLAAWAQLTLGLRPLKALVGALKAVRDGRLSRLGTEFPSEIAPLVEDLNKLLDRQEQLVRKARDRAGALAHGLKTPLTILRAETRRLEMDGRRDVALRMNEQLDQIRRHADRELARSRTSGAPAAAGASTDVGQTVERLLRLMRRMPRGAELDWQLVVPAGLGVRMEPDDFGEILGNLLDNARKWAATRVVVRADPAGDTVRIVVEDDGPGFPAQVLERGMSDGPDSSGLGLSIVQDALAEYGRALGIERHPGGCRVWFEAIACPASAAIVPFPGKLADAARSARGAAR